MAFRRSIGSSIARSSLTRAVEPLRQAAKSMYRVGSGPAVRNDGTPRPRLRDTIAKRVRQYRAGDGFYAVVGPRGRDDGKRGSDAPHAHLIERGTVKRYRQIINGAFFWVMFNREWALLSRSAQRAAKPDISHIRPHISHPVTGLYQRFYNARYAALSATESTAKRRTGAGPEYRIMAKAWLTTSTTVATLFSQVMAEKIAMKAARWGMDS